MSAIEEIINLLAGVPTNPREDKHLKHANDFAQGVKDIDRLLGGLAPISKAGNPNDVEEFDRLVVRLSTNIGAANRVLSNKHYRLAFNRLRGVPWDKMTEASIESLIVDAAAFLPDPTLTANMVAKKLESFGKVVGPRTKNFMAAAIEDSFVVDWAASDAAMLESMSTNAGLFVTNSMGVVNTEWSIGASNIVKDGLDQGLGRKEISKLLSDKFSAKEMARKNANYWDVVASNHANRSRQWSNLSAMDDAGVTRFFFEAVLDNRTTEICNMLHGKSFEVKAAQAKYEQVNESVDPTQAKSVMPWVQMQRGEDGRAQMYIKNPDGSRNVFATVAEAGAGVADRRGTYETKLSDADLEAMGFTTPPCHGLCRSSIIADI